MALIASFAGSVIAHEACTTQDGVFFHGDEHDNICSANDRDNIMDGRAGNDILRGQAGGDFIAGASHDDLLNGQTGDDRLLGGPGDDDLRGGDGDDRIEDWIDAGDRDRVCDGPELDTILLDDGDGQDVWFIAPDAQDDIEVLDEGDRTSGDPCPF